MSKSVFVFTNYKEFLRSWVKSRPNNGRGELRRLAKALRVHSTLISQVVNGARDPSLEQAVELADIIGLTSNAKKYFLRLVQFAKAGSKKLQDTILEEINDLRIKEQDIATKFSGKNELNESAKAIFYSEWTYSAIRLITDLNSIKNTEQISKALNLPLSLVKDRLDFLISCGLCVQDSAGVKLGTAITHLPKLSKLIGLHHRNWRLKAMERIPTLTPKELMFTAPLSISNSDGQKVQNLILDFIENLKKITESSKADEIRVINIDWIKIFQS